MTKNNSYLLAGLFTACIAVLALPAFQLYFAGPMFKAYMTGHAEHEAILVATHVKNMLLEKTPSFSAEALNRKNASSLKMLSRDFALINLKAFDSEGTVIYSENDSEIGRKNDGTYFAHIRESGEPVTEVILSGGTSLEEKKQTLDLVETYVPAFKDGRFAGAVEVYYDISEERRKFESMLGKFGSVIFLIVLVLGLFMLFSYIKLCESETMRILAQQDIERNFRLFREFVEKAPAAIAMIDPKLKYQARSNRWKEIFPETESLAKALGGPENEPPHEAPYPSGWRDAIKQCLNGERVSSDKDFMLLADGSSEWVRWEMLPWQERAKDTAGIVVFVEVVTETLEKIRQESTRRDMHTMRKIVSGMAHELRNPLCSVSAIADILCREAPQDEHAKLLKALKAESRRMSTLITELNSYGKQWSTSLDNVNASDVLKKILKEFQASHPEVSFRVLGTEFGPIYTDENLLCEALRRLVENSVDAGASDVVFAAMLENAQPVISILDDGIGMTEEDLQRAAEPFFTTRRGRTGLGLSFCSKAAGELDASLYLHSSPGEGTIARFTFNRELYQGGGNGRGVSNMGQTQTEVVAEGLKGSQQT